MRSKRFFRGFSYEVYYCKWGLAELYAAHRLSKQEHDYILLEANNHGGGRASG
ncbi:FAD/NAD(P)-binding protein [Streptococcus troglodytae]|uniref:FAD/NAD(P)-binding protein n=1 Tax=Streptococcus troglodytae TaxID=1111760 RepID=UPI0033656A79